MDKIIENTFQNLPMSTIKHTSKMHLVCLKLQNEPIPGRLDEKRKVVSEHEKSIISKSKKLKEIKAKLIVRTSCALVAQLMSSRKIANIETHCNQCLSKLYCIHRLPKPFSNKTSKYSYS